MNIELININTLYDKVVNDIEKQKNADYIKEITDLRNRFLNNAKQIYEIDFKTFEEYIKYIAENVKDSITNFQIHYSTEFFGIRLKFFNIPIKLINNDIKLKKEIFYINKYLEKAGKYKLNVETIIKEIKSNIKVNDNKQILKLKEKKTEEEKKIFKQIEDILFDKYFIFDITEENDNYNKRIFKHFNQGVLRKQNENYTDNRFFIFLILQGEQSRGKSYLAETLIKVYDKLNCLTITTDGTTFIKNIEEKRFDNNNGITLINEDIEFTNKTQPKLKELITGENINIQYKFEKYDNKEKNKYSFIETSNNYIIDDIHFLTGEDRRFFNMDIRFSNDISEENLFKLLLLYVYYLDYSNDNKEDIIRNITDNSKYSIKQTNFFILDKIKEFCLADENNIEKIKKEKSFQTFLGILNKCLKSDKGIGITTEALKNFIKTQHKTFNKIIIKQRKSNNYIQLNDKVLNEITINDIAEDNKRIEEELRNEEIDRILENKRQVINFNDLQIEVDNDYLKQFDNVEKITNNSNNNELKKEYVKDNNIPVKENKSNSGNNSNSNANNKFNYELNFKIFTDIEILPQLGFDNTKYDESIRYIKDFLKENKLIIKKQHLKTKYEIDDNYIKEISKELLNDNDLLKRFVNYIQKNKYRIDYSN